MRAGFRKPEAQAVLSTLAASDRVHLVASFDHVNTPQLWDPQLAARFNWLWHDITTYTPYVSEFSRVAVPSELVGRRCAFALHPKPVLLLGFGACCDG